MEGFFGILKRKSFYGFEKTFRTIDELEQAIKDYIHYYNHDRIKTGLKKPYSDRISEYGFKRHKLIICPNFRAHIL